MWFFFRKKKDISPAIYSVETCEDCGQASRRNFEPRDYVYKRTVNCKNCSGIVMISSIYGEYPAEKQNKIS